MKYLSIKRFFLSQMEVNVAFIHHLNFHPHPKIIGGLIADFISLFWETQISSEFSILNVSSRGL